MSPERGGEDPGFASCPRCGRGYAPSERFCSSCRMPLVPGGGGEQEPRGEAHDRARKVRPQYAKGRLVRVAVGRNQAEGELIQGVLLEQGIPSLVRRTQGFDVPDFVAAGPRDVLVPESGVAVARELLGEEEGSGEGGADDRAPLVRSLRFRLTAGLFAAMLASGALVGVAYLVWALAR